MKKTVTTVSAIFLALVFLGCSEPLTTREKGAGIGAAVGLLGGALIGDQLQSRQKQDQQVQQRIDSQQAEIERQKREIEQLKTGGEY